MINDGSRHSTSDYKVLGAAAQIPIILTGSNVSLLNLQMRYYNTELIITDNLHFFVRTKYKTIKLHMGQNIKKTTLSMLTNLTAMRLSMACCIFAT